MIKKHTGDIRSFLNPATLEAASSPIGNAYEVTMVDAHKIYVNEKNLYGIRGIEEMANSMAVSDNIPPLVVTPIENGKYKLISGERRLSAVLLREQRGEIENPKVPCFIREIQPIGPLSAEQSEMMLLILENAHRDKTPLEKLNEIKAMEPMARKIYADERAKGNIKGSFRSFFAESILNMSEASVKRLKALDRLIPDAKDALEDGRISQSAAVDLSKKTESKQKQYIDAMEQGEAQESQVQKEPAEGEIASPPLSTSASLPSSEKLKEREKPQERKASKPQAGEKTKDRATDVVNEQFSDKEQAVPSGDNYYSSAPETVPSWPHEWTMVNYAITEELRNRIATAQNNARKSENAAIVLHYNRLAAVYEVLLNEFLKDAVFRAIYNENEPKEQRK